MDLHSVSLKSEPLAKLKSLSISNSMNDLANIPSMKLFSEALSPTVPDLSLKNLGFVSLCKATPVVSRAIISARVRNLFRRFLGLLRINLGIMK